MTREPPAQPAGPTAEARAPQAPLPILVVDLDGTLVRTDLLFETFLLLLKQNPLYVLLVPLWLWRGKAWLKQEIARRVVLDAARLPYREDVVAWLAAERRRGRRVVLATAADQALAKAVAEHTGLFDDVLASDGRTNLSGSRKLARIRALAGEQGFAYAGDADVDVVIWQAADGAIAVNAAPARVKRWQDERIAFEQVFPAEARTAHAVVKALRPHQWAKNLLVFVPVVLAHKTADADRLVAAVAAFVAFSLTASSVYVLNDLLDIAADRRHERKRKRPFAAGALSIPTGFALVPALLLPAVVVGVVFTSRELVAVLGVYYAITVFYSLFLKRVLLVDVITLAGLYTIRLFAGAVAADVAVSKWLGAFALFIFLTLALVKRFTELLAMKEQGGSDVAGRGYQVRDLEPVLALGTASGFVAVLVLALYIQSVEVTRLYQRPEVLWGMLPLMLYWTSRVWILARRGEVHDDPILFAVKDRTSYVVAGLLLAVVMLAV